MLSRNAINMKTRPLALCHKTRPLPQNRQRPQNSAAAAKVTVQRHLEPPRLLAAGGAGSRARAAGDALVGCSLRARHLKHTTRKHLPSCLESHITYSPTTNHYMRTDKADHYTRTDQPAAGSHRPAGCRPGSTDVQQPRAWRGTRGAPSGRTCGTAERRGERPLPCQNGSDALQGRPRKWSAGAPSLRRPCRSEVITMSLLDLGRSSTSFWAGIGSPVTTCASCTLRAEWSAADPTARSRHPYGRSRGRPPHAQRCSSGTGNSGVCCAGWSRPRPPPSTNPPQWLPTSLPHRSDAIAECRSPWTRSGRRNLLRSTTNDSFGGLAGARGLPPPHRSRALWIFHWLSGCWGDP